MNEAPHPEEVRFLYRNWRGKISLRRARPLSFAFAWDQWHPDSQWLMYARDLDKGEMRNFALRDCHFNPPEWVLADPDKGLTHPEAEGHYFVLFAGDSESVDGHTIYSFDDYTEWAYWHPAQPEELEDFEGGFKGNWSSSSGEPESIIAWCGPVRVPDKPLVSG